MKVNFQQFYKNSLFSKVYGEVVKRTLVDENSSILTSIQESPSIKLFFYSLVNNFAKEKFFESIEESLKVFENLEMKKMVNMINIIDFIILNQVSIKIDILQRIKIYIEKCLKSNTEREKKRENSLSGPENHILENYIIFCNLMLKQQNPDFTNSTILQKEESFLFSPIIKDLIYEGRGMCEDLEKKTEIENYCFINFVLLISFFFELKYLEDFLTNSNAFKKNNEGLRDNLSIVYDTTLKLGYLPKKISEIFGKGRLKEDPQIYLRFLNYHLIDLEIYKINIIEENNTSTAQLIILQNRLSTTKNPEEKAKIKEEIKNLLGTVKEEKKVGEDNFINMLEVVYFDKWNNDVPKESPIEYIKKFQRVIFPFDYPMVYSIMIYNSLFTKNERINKNKVFKSFVKILTLQRNIDKIKRLLNFPIFEKALILAFYWKIQVGIKKDPKIKETEKHFKIIECVKSFNSITYTKTFLGKCYVYLYYLYLSQADSYFYIGKYSEAKSLYSKILLTFLSSPMLEEYNRIYERNQMPSTEVDLIRTEDKKKQIKAKIAACYWKMGKKDKKCVTKLISDLFKSKREFA